MSGDKQSDVLSILQPDLLPAEKLLEIIVSRCFRAENLRLMSKERLVELFRRVVLPLPQRLYRTNRRGKMLTARRAKAGLSTERKEEGSSQTSGRLKPPPDISNSHRLRLNSRTNGETSRSRDLDKIVIKDRRKSDGEDDGGKDARTSRPDSPSGRKITLKRPQTSEKPTETPPPSDSKRRRTAIKWP